MRIFLTELIVTVLFFSLFIPHKGEFVAMCGRPVDVHTGVYSMAGGAYRFCLWVGRTAIFFGRQEHGHGQRLRILAPGCRFLFEQDPI